MNQDKVVKASIWYLISSFLLKGIGLITTPVFSRMLTKAEYGIAENFNALLSIMIIVASLCLPATLIRARFDFKDSLISYIKTCLLINIITSIIIAFCFSLFKTQITEFFFLDTKYFVVLFFVVSANPAFEIFILLNQFDYKYKKVSVINSLVAILGIGFSFLLLLFFKENIFAKLFGAQIPLIILGITLYFFFFTKRGKINFRYVKYILPIAIPFVIHSLSGAILNSADRIMITNICGTEENALYSIGCSVGQLANVLWAAMNTAFVPWLGEIMHLKKYDELRKFSTFYISFFVVCVLGVILIAPELLFFLGGSKYSEAKYVIPAIVISNVFLFLYSMYVNIEQYEKKTNGMALATTISAVINIVLNWILIPIYGYVVAAYTTMLGYLVMLILHYFLVKRIKLHQCYNSVYILLVSCVCLLFSFIIPVVYDFFFVRIILIGIYVLCLILFFIKNRSRIVAFIQKKSEK